MTYTLTQFEGVEGARLVSGDTVVEPQVDRRELAAPKRGPKPVVRARGPKLPGTRAIQKRLAKLSYLPKRAIDGVAGYQTEQAVIAFQSWEGLGRDGDRRPDHRCGAEDRAAAEAALGRAAEAASRSIATRA